MEMTRGKITVSFIIILIAIIYGYIFFERYITESTISITVINKAPFGDEASKYLIFTKDEVFEDVNNSYQDASNADQIYDQLKIGGHYKVKVVGFYLPSIPHFRNIVSIEHDDNEYNNY
jgi:hypothetical protein